MGDATAGAPDRAERRVRRHCAQPAAVADATPLISRAPELERAWGCSRRPASFGAQVRGIRTGRADEMMQRMPLDLVELEAGLEGEWERYVRRSPQATVAHLLGWRNVVVRTYGHTPHYLVARQDRQVCGVLPLFLVRSRL